ncbi:MAG TPA: YceI family protein [Thermoanaerobaculia bacterium]|nr:YceI family protein [Thermoanaerobaculia bacterium]
MTPSRLARAAAASLAAGALALAATGAAPAAAAPATYKADVDHSAVAFSVRHFVTPVPGRFRDWSAKIVYDREQPAGSSVELRVRADSIETDNDDRDAHLRSADFFDAARFPELTFASTSVRALDARHLEVAGDLTIRGVARRIVLPVELLGIVPTPQGERIGFTAAFSIDRKDYGVTWNRVIEGAGAILGDEVRITISIEALRAADPKKPSPGGSP